MKAFLDQKINGENQDYRLHFSITSEEDHSICEEKDKFLTDSYFFKNDKTKKVLYIIDNKGAFKKDFFIINLVDERNIPTEENKKQEFIKENIKMITCHNLTSLVTNVCIILILINNLLIT